MRTRLEYLIVVDGHGVFPCALCTTLHDGGKLCCSVLDERSTWHGDPAKHGFVSGGAQRRVVYADASRPLG